jgi:cyclopropane fatty-acyl-phospholipid synthase-like methyltransferase
MSNESDAKYDYWRSFWREFPTAFSEGDFFRQVGHTIDGKPYSSGQFAAMLASIVSQLELSGEDSLLDICCGNGLITSKLSTLCDKVVAVDFSPSLVKVAKKHHAAPNITYQCVDALALAGARLRPDRFSRVLMYAALQHFQVEDLEPLLRGVCEHAADESIVLFGGVLDMGRKFNFLDTAEKRAMYERYCAEGKDRLGTWWDARYVTDVCESLGLVCDIHWEEDGRPGGHYRFDAVIRRKGLRRSAH